MPRPSPSAPPLDPAALERLALRYVERYATTRARLAGYLARKLRERGFAGDDPGVAGLVERLASLGYLNDQSFAEARARSLARRGYGARRVDQALRAAGVEEGDRRAAAPDAAAGAAAAIAYARRRRIGAFAAEDADRTLRDKWLASLLRAGHDAAVARALVRLAPGEDAEEALAEWTRPALS